MSSQLIEENEISDIQPLLSATRTFLQKLKGIEWLSVSSKEDVKNCLRSASHIEKILLMLQNNGFLDDFVTMLPNLYGLSIEELCKVCDTVLEMILVTPGVSLSCVRACFQEYLILCGSERLESVLTNVISRSEMYRILLDYFCSSESNPDHLGTLFQSELLSRVWKMEADSIKLKSFIYRWLQADASGQNIAVAIQIVRSEDGDYHVSSCLASTLAKILNERGDSAVLFWKVLLKKPHHANALGKFGELLETALEFWKTSGLWMQATANSTKFTWVSKENGPCRALGFDELVQAMKILLQIKGRVYETTKDFLSKRKNFVGCTLWDDVEIQLNHLQFQEQMESGQVGKGVSID